MANNRASVADRIAGGLLGVHAGDSLGATHEFQPWSRSATTTCRGVCATSSEGVFHVVARGRHRRHRPHPLRPQLVPARRPIRPDRHRQRHQEWMDASPPDIGNATRSGLRGDARTGNPRDAGSGIGSCGNGSLMRCIPTGLPRADADVRALEFRDLAVTHNDPICQDACVAYNSLVAALVDGVGVAGAIANGVGDASPAVADAIDAGRRLDLADLAQNHGNPYGGSGYVLP